MKVNKKSIIWPIFTVIVAAWAVNYIVNDGTLNYSVNPSPSPSVATQAEGVGPKSGIAGTKTYTQLVAQYTDRRIQFDMLCQAIPSNITYKNGTSVMFDNRSGDARVITIGGTKYNFSGYGYKIITLSSSKLPLDIYLSCGSGVNVGRILLQK